MEGYGTKQKYLYTRKLHILANPSCKEAKLIKILNLPIMSRTGALMLRQCAIGDLNKIIFSMLFRLSVWDDSVTHQVIASISSNPLYNFHIQISVFFPSYLVPFLSSEVCINHNLSFSNPLYFFYVLEEELWGEGLFF